MPEATLAILNAHVMTLNPKQPSAQAVAIQNNKTIAVGSNTEIQKHVSKNTKIVNAKNRMIIPGLVDCHIHMTGFGYSLQTLELRNTTSIKQLQKRLKEYAAKNPQRKWILGRGWDQDRFHEKRYPTRSDLDAAVPNKPILLTRVCGHICVVNSKALNLAKITKETVIEGGKVDLDDKTGEPTGILREDAMKLANKALPKHTSTELEDAMLLACEKAAEAGLTCVHWLVESPEEIKTLQKLHSEGKLPLRVHLGIPVKFLAHLASLGFLTGFGNDRLKLGFVKILADGSLGGHTAALKEPYADRPETCGMMLYTQKQLNRLISEAHKAGMQLAVHAIGDHAMEKVLTAYAKALSSQPRKSHRHRIEHCSVLNPKLIKRMKSLDLIASIQPHFVESDFWVVDRVGKTRARWVYPFRTLVHEGMLVVSGSDCPVEPVDPLLGIWAAVTRKNYAEERLTVEEAVRTYTLNAAFASFDEDKRGTIETGKLADLTVLSDDLLSIAPNNIRTTKVDMTIVDGKVIYARKPSRRLL